MTVADLPVPRAVQESKRTSVHYPGLDGLRALAVIAVIVYHLNPAWLPGGYLGVDIFFVVSGYLITSLLVAEWERRGTIQLRQFWKRRAKRLLPALAALFFAVTLLAAIFARDAVPRLRGDLPASLLFVMNWRLAFQHESYVTSVARPALLLHLWSLAVEEQFYLLWPPALLLLLKRRIPLKRIAAIAGAAAAGSALVMALTYRSHADPSFVYFATDSHSEGLLLGCTLGATLRPSRMAAAVSARARLLLYGLGAVSLLTIALGAAVFAFRSGATYRGGMVLVDAAVAAAIVVLVHPACRLGAALGVAPLRWAGTRSYSLYLWHWPIFELTRPGIDIAASGWPVGFLRLAATAAAAEGSYRFVEQPWRTGRAQALVRAQLRRSIAQRRWALGMAAAPVVAVVAITATVSAPSAPAVLAEGATPAARIAPVGPPSPPSSSHQGGQPLMAGAASPTTAPAGAGSPGVSAAAGQGEIEEREPILAIGDSVLLAASPALTGAFGSAITIDAAVGRQTESGLERLSAYRASGQLAHYHTLVIDLGTNGLFTAGQFQALVQLCAGVPLVVVYTVHAQRSWIAGSNSTITGSVAGRPNMRLADWNAIATPSLLYPDGIHPNAAGAQAYTQLLEHDLSQP